jgi:hypothetical protein
MLNEMSSAVMAKRLDSESPRLEKSNPMPPPFRRELIDVLPQIVSNNAAGWPSFQQVS